VITPTDDQIDILNSTARYNVIFGNAGAAKTTALAMKIKDLLDSGQSFENVLVLLYSDAAVLALRQRLLWLGLTKEAARAVPAMTFAELCHERLAPIEGRSKHLKHPNRLVHEALLRAVTDASEWAARRGYLSSFELDAGGVLAFPTLLHAFRQLKGMMVLQSLDSEFALTPESAYDVGIDFTQAAVLRAYERLRRGRIGAEEVHRGEEAVIKELEEEALFRLEDDPFYDMAVILEDVDAPFDFDSHPLRLGAKFLFVDEGHDLNKAMFTVLQHLISVNPIEQLFVVGDPDQVIHSDSGAAPNFMTDTLHLGGSSKRFSLPLCRRFGEGLAIPLGVHARKPYEVLETNRTVVSIYKAADYVGISTLVAGAHSKASAVDPDRNPSLAVLLRQPGTSVQLENDLALKGFHVETNGFEPYMQRPEVHFLRVMVAWASDAMDTLARADLVAIQAALGEFTGFSSHVKAKDVQHKVVETLTQYVFGTSPTSFLAGAESDLDPKPLLYYSDDAALQAIRQFLSDFLDGVETSALAAVMDSANLMALAKRAFVFEERTNDAVVAMREFAKSATGFGDFRTWLQQIANREHAASRQARASRATIRMYSIPASKGLEFDHVIIPNVNGGVFDGDNQEERNLFYVAASRARKELTMTYQARPSSFLEPFQDSANWDEIHSVA
jgi:DNA helicase-2/ATP-dependent DNA helicase PcrA